MQRPKPTKQLLIEECGGNQGLISNAHHGLYESRILSQFYPNLDFDELMAFAASSWKAREKDLSEFRAMVARESIYGVFNEVFKIGYPWLNKYKQISPALQQKHKELNPYQGKDLKERLQRVPAQHNDQLRKELVDRVNNFVFECEYQKAKMARGGDNYKIEPMLFQNVYPKRERIVPAYAAEVSKIISNYPAEFEPVKKFEMRRLF